MDNLRVVIIDYGIGNLHSVNKACENVGMNVLVSNDKKEIENADGLILPGVGAFGDAMNNLKKNDLINPILDFAQSGKLMMGVCLGMQLLMTESEEFNSNKGLNLIEGKCIKFPNFANNELLKVPHTMWNTIYTSNNEFEKNSPLCSVKNEEFMYFVHSFHVLTENKENTLAYTNYGGIEFSSAIIKNNIFGFQFHPEKSGIKGLEIYKNFYDLLNKKNGK